MVICLKFYSDVIFNRCYSYFVCLIQIWSIAIAPYLLLSHISDIKKALFSLGDFFTFEKISQNCNFDSLNQN